MLYKDILGNPLFKKKKKKTRLFNVTKRNEMKRTEPNPTKKKKKYKQELKHLQGILSKRKHSTFVTVKHIKWW